MDWLPIASAVVSVIGTGGIGGFFLAYRKNNKEADRAEKLNEARIKEVEATTNLKIQEAQSKFVEQLQAANDKANQRIDELTSKVDAQGRVIDAQGKRIVLLEGVLIQHNIPLPE
jgi:uncharacterized protein YneF (UPF0154 family)